MINPNQLRIGNLVQVRKNREIAGVEKTENSYFEIEELATRWVIFKGIHSDGMIRLGVHYRDLKGIHLNRGLLSLYGFKRRGDTMILSEMDFEIHYDKDFYGTDVRIRVGPAELIAINIDYLHELQNLYFAMTGKELELKHHGKTTMS